jgi:flagellar hook-associated protein 2
VTGMSVDGLVSGINTSEMIRQLMQLERQPQMRLAARRDAATAKAAIYQTLNTRFAAVKDAAAALTRAGGFAATRATSSAADAVAATALPTAPAGSLTFRVDRLASAHSLVSAATVSSLGAPLGPTGRWLSVDAGALGLTGLTASADLALGPHTIEVTRATTAASHKGSPLAATTTIATGTTFRVTVDGGAARDIALVPGTYDRQQLAAMVTTAAGGDLRATVAADGALVLSTVREGSAASLSVSRGTAIGFPNGNTGVSTGTDGAVTLDGRATVVTDTRAPLVLAAPGGGSITADASAGLRVGATTATLVDHGEGTLTELVASINRAGAGVTASAVQVAPGQYRLQLTSTTTGVAGRIDLVALGLDRLDFGVVEEGHDARVTVGTGPGAYTVSSPTNTLADVLPGVTFSLRRAGPDPVTVTVADDGEAVADRVKALVDAVNAALQGITSQSRYDPDARKGGPLLGDHTARSLQGQLHAAVGGAGALRAAGIEVTRDGTLRFDRAAFTAAYEADPQATAAAFRSEQPAPDGGRTGLAHRLEALGKRATDPVTGAITTVINGRKEAARQLDRQVDAWDARLLTREAALRRQFSGLEVALGQLRDRSTWLAGQLAGLSTNWNK